MGNVGQILLLLPARFSENSGMKLRVEFDPLYSFRNVQRIPEFPLRINVSVYQKCILLTIKQFHFKNQVHVSTN